MEIHIDASHDGTNIKTFLRSHLGLSQKFLRSIKFREDGILKNGVRVTVREILHKGDVLTLALENEITEKEPPVPVNLAITILYEDESIVLPSKPAGMPTHPSHNHHGDTVANALAYRYRNDPEPFVFRPINRLDRNTSGILLVARQRLAASKLSADLKAGKFQKTYVAILDGVLPEDHGLLHDYLHRSADSIILREVTSEDAPDAEEAKTAYRVLYRGKDHTLVLAKAITGRTHQLRVQFAHFGFPISGDDLYGTLDERIGRHALHAAKLCFPHPTTREPLSFTSLPPNDFSDFAATVFGADIPFQSLLTENLL